MFGRNHNKSQKSTANDRINHVQDARVISNRESDHAFSSGVDSEWTILSGSIESLPSRKEKHSRQKKREPVKGQPENKMPSLIPSAPNEREHKGVSPSPTAKTVDPENEQAPVELKDSEFVTEKVPQVKEKKKKSHGNLPIGLVFEGNTLIFSEIQSIKSGFRGRKLYVKDLQDLSFPIAEDNTDKFTELVQEVVRDAGWKRRKVVMAAPSEYVMLRHTSIAKMSKKVLDVAIRAEVSTNLSFPFEEPYFDYVVLEESSISDTEADNLSVIIVAAPKNDLIRYASCVRRAGLVPVRIEPVILGIQRIVATKIGISDQKLLYAVLNLRFDGAELGIFEGDNLLFMRHIEQKPADYPRQSIPYFAESAMEEVAASELASNESTLLPGEVEDFDERSYASDLSYELDRSLNFVHYNLIKNGLTIGVIYIVSAIVDIDAITESLSGRLDQEIHVIESQLLFERPVQAPETFETPWTVRSARYAASALGLSLPEVKG